ncbi:MAG TPA: type I glutamate--ammonia ligase [Sulfolobales archaeon]|nr:type I glutamate--ammonia ligase [Sulfolobales archaeon]
MPGKVWLDIMFTDLLGVLRSVSYRVNEEEVSKVSGIIGKTDGSSVYGFTGIEDSDLFLNPIESTLAKTPWDAGRYMVLSKVYYRDSRFTRDPRLVAEKTEEVLGADGYEAYVSMEPEFFIVEKIDVGIDRSMGIYKQKLRIYSHEGSLEHLFPVKRSYQLPLENRYEHAITEIIRGLEAIGVGAEVIHHEVATSQFELNFAGGSPTAVSDALQIIKLTMRKILDKLGLQPLFMPKPFWGDNGSGLHTHISLWKNRVNAFYDESDSYARISQLCRYFIGGLIEHGRSLSAIVSPTVNSYKRLVPGYEAPVYLTWGRSNRSAAIRIPAALSSNKVRIEYRPPDPTSNPYLTTSAITLAGLDGIAKKIDPGDPVDENVYRMTPERRRQLGIKSLPRSLEEALDELESDNQYLLKAFPKDLLETYIEVKREEARRVSSMPSPIDYIEYLHL